MAVTRQPGSSWADEFPVTGIDVVVLAVATRGRPRTITSTAFGMRCVAYRGRGDRLPRRRRPT